MYLKLSRLRVNWQGGGGEGGQGNGRTHWLRAEHRAGKGGQNRGRGQNGELQAQCALELRPRLEFGGLAVALPRRAYRFASLNW